MQTHVHFLFSSGMATEWDMREGDNLLCLVTAEGGWGKTALLAGLVHQAVKVPIKSFFFFFFFFLRIYACFVQWDSTLLPLVLGDRNSWITSLQSKAHKKKKIIKKRQSVFLYSCKANVDQPGIT